MTILEKHPLILTIPLREDPPGVLRVGQSRVLLELVVQAFQEGKTPESIVQSYDTLELSDVYAVIGYYMANPDPVDDYIRESDLRAETLRQEIEASQPPRESLRQLVMRRAQARGMLDDQTADR